MTLIMKTCFKCGSTKPLDDFYKHPEMADGHLNKCKECTKSDVHNRRHGAGRESVLAYDRSRGALPHRKAMVAKVTAAWRENHPDRKAAQQKLHKAVKSGIVTPWPVCAVPECGKKPEAHHPDYSQPLAVVWLCREHHMQAHALKND